MARLEILDELEEWHLLSAHYCVAWAYKSSDYIHAFSTIQLQQEQQAETLLVFKK
jgi:tRNA wybutosine-synthesizing protein 4